MNNFNYFDYLLIMSVEIRSYKLVSRDYLRKLVSEPTNDNCECNFCKYCGYIKFIKEELHLNSFETHNKSVNWWRIEHTCGNITVTPELDDKSD